MGAWVLNTLTFNTARVGGYYYISLAIGVAMDKDGNIYVTNNGNHSLFNE